MYFPSAKAVLRINGKSVGHVTRIGCSTSWSYGKFQPSDAFAEFSPLFSRWAQLMHSGDPAAPLDEGTLGELSRLESIIDSLHASLVWPRRPRATPLAQVNIDGTLIEWKEAAAASLRQ